MNGGGGVELYSKTCTAERVNRESLAKQISPPDKGVSCVGGVQKVKYTKLWGYELCCTPGGHFFVPKGLLPLAHVSNGGCLMTGSEP